MEIINLKLNNYRSYKKLNLNFSPRINLIIGPNGIGKTNLVEAIYVLAITKSFRTNNDDILIKNNAKQAKLECNVRDIIINNYKIIINKEGKKVKRNNKIVKKYTDYFSNIQLVLFNPNDLRFIKDSPTIRRKSINIEISQFNNSYLKIMNNYNKILKQRNAYLKNKSKNLLKEDLYFNIITEKLIDLGLSIYEERKKYFQKINNYITKYYQEIIMIKELTIKYYSDYTNNNKEKLLLKYKNLIDRDIFLGKTSFGIHHDDFIFSTENGELKKYGSEGQQKSAIIAYKLAEIKLFKEKTKQYPILILDDLLSELDNERIEKILNLLNNRIQIFITTTDINKISQKIVKKSKIIEINGSIMEVNNE